MAANSSLSLQRFARSTKPLVACCAVSIWASAFATDASAQRPLRRLGDRIREGILNVQRLPPSLPPAPQSPADRALVPGRSNYNAPQTSLRPAVAPTPQPALPGRATQASATAAVDSGEQARTARSRARLGVTVETPPQRVTAGGARDTRGARVIGVDAGSSAEAAGLLIGDRIVAVDGRMIENIDDLVRVLASLREGKPMDIMYVRDEQLAQTTAVIGRPQAAVQAVGPAVSAEQQAIAESGSSILDRGTGANTLPPPTLAPARPADVPGEVGVTDTDSGSGAPTAAQGLGRMLGNLLGGDSRPADSPAVDASGNKPADTSGNEPAEETLPAPRTGPAESMGPAESTSPAASMGPAVSSRDFEPLSLQQTDPPSLEGPSLELIAPEAKKAAKPESDTQPLPQPAEDPFAAGFTDDLAPAVPSPSAQEGKSDDAVQTSAKAERETVRSLLDEIERLRQRVKQLEAARPAATD